MFPGPKGDARGGKRNDLENGLTGCASAYDLFNEWIQLVSPHL